MQSATLESDKNTGSKFAHLAAKAAEGKMLYEDLTEIGKRRAQRLIRRGREAGEDYLDETTQYVKHHPWHSVAIAAGVGVLPDWFWAGPVLEPANRSDEFFRY
jgi:ElaB/YqjD/DUF883 family membrane-anchored ribosome-binding protein